MEINPKQPPPPRKPEQPRAGEQVEYSPDYAFITGLPESQEFIQARPVFLESMSGTHARIVNARGESLRRPIPTQVS